ncbi:hypothetical protein NQ317_016533 [Molorchus minor]|uniref:Uncharacterized protein n=1 Tax=Molorchus minor TaxID=1323400 RepID=A0ABQ9JEP2_9CUCU|nr:hypothetical protein NQ317_016533 [Molorchus minor]
MEVCLRSATDSCTALVFTFALLMGLSSTLAAPTKTDSDWLINPCNKQPQLRHGRSAAENQLRIFINHIDSRFIKEIKQLYNTPQNTTLKGNCPKINNMLKPIKMAKTKNMAMQLVYETLLQFAVFIEKLKDTPIKTSGEFNISKRKSIFKGAKENLRLLICEFNDTLSKYNDKHIQPNKPRVPEINLMCLPDFLDLTRAQLIDTDFFKKIKKFLKQSRRSLKKKKPKKNALNKKSVPNNKRRTKKV